jgi:acyl-CoA synthetase (AMP-forming)/AMP-acid ligase II
MGEIGVAVVVPATGSTAPTLAALRDFGAPHLARWKLPEAVVVVDSLPLTSMQKLDRAALAATVQRPDAVGKVGSVPPPREG